MLQRNAMRADSSEARMPLESQVVEVRVGNADWQPATYRDGQFVDVYGMTLDRKRVSGWRPAGRNAVNGH